MIIKQTKYDDLEKIEQIFPAYQATSTASDQDQAMFVWLEPVWCMKYNGKTVILTNDLLTEGARIMEWNKTKTIFILAFVLDIFLGFQYFEKRSTDHFAIIEKQIRWKK